MSISTKTQYWFSVTSAAIYLGTSRDAVHGYIRAGYLQPRFRPGSKRKWFDRMQLDGLNVPAEAITERKGAI